MGSLIRHPGTIRAQRKKLEERKLLVEKTLKDTPEGDEAYSKLLSESLWLHGVISGLDWALGTGSIDNLFEDLLPNPPMEEAHEDGPGLAGGEVRPPDGPQPGAVVPE